MDALRIFCIALLMLSAHLAAAEEYLVRIDFGGYHDVPEEIEATPETIDRSIELVCQPGVRAHSKVRFDKETVSVTLLLRQRDDAAFEIGLDIYEGVDSGEVISDGKGGTTTRVESSRAQTRTTIAKFGDTITIGGVLSTRNVENAKPASSMLGKLLSKQPSVKEKTIKSKKGIWLTLEKYAPPAEDDSSFTR